MMRTEIKRVKLNVDLLTFKAGQVVKLEFKGGVPVDRFWRRRLVDAKIDNCIQVVSAKKPDKKLKVNKHDG